MSVRGPGFAYENLELALVGDYQPANAALAVASAHLMARVPDDAVRRGLAAVVWPGRLQVVGQQPRVILDGGHNPAAMTKAGASLRALIGGERLVALFAMLSERDPQQLFVALRTLAPDAVVFTEATGAAGHAVDPVQLASLYGPGGEAVSHPEAALARAKQLAGTDGNVLVCGSLYLVGEVLAMAQQPTSRD
jgi:dihydrofolate synthase/folylpolyglutamate synthase